MRVTSTAGFIVGVLAALCAHAAQAQTPFPTRPLRVIAPVPPGGSGDMVARLLAQKLGERLGQHAVVDNRAGAAGVIAAEITARAAPDGHTLLVVSTTYAQLPAIQKLPFDPLKSLAAVAQIVAGPNSICSYPAYAAHNIKDLVALAKAKPGELRYASSGTGGVNHFGGELFNQLAGVKLTHIPYKGGGPAIIDVIAGRVEVMFGSLLAVLPHVRGGRLKALGVGSPKRSPLLPEVAAIAETVPGYDGGLWWGVLAPAGVPQALITRLNADINAILREPEMAKRLANEAAEPTPGTPDAFAKLIAADVVKWARIAKESGIRAE